MKPEVYIQIMQVSEITQVRNSSVTADFVNIRMGLFTQWRITVFLMNRLQRRWI